MIFRKNIKNTAVWPTRYEVLLASPFSPKMSVAFVAYKRPVLDHFRFRHAPFSAAILSKECITKTISNEKNKEVTPTINK